MIQSDELPLSEILDSLKTQLVPPIICSLRLLQHSRNSAFCGYWVAPIAYFASRDSFTCNEALRESLADAEARFQQKFGFATPHTTHCEAMGSREDPCLQACDYMMWALQRYFERGESRYIEMMWGKVGEVVDLDLEYGNCRGKSYGLKARLIDPPKDEDAIGATHHLFIAITSALQKFRILRTMGGTNCVFLVVVNCTCRDTVRRYLDTLGLFVQRESHFRKAMIR